MTVAIQHTSALPPTLPPEPLAFYQFTVRQYHRLIQSAVLTESDRVELLEGCLVRKMPHSPAHAGTITNIQLRLQPVLGTDWLIRIQSAITTRDSEPEPDLVVVPGPAAAYFSRHPGPQDIALVIEVADSSLQDDRTIKARLYARCTFASIGS